MIFSLDVRRARNGDCLLLHFGSVARPGLVMIDGGTSSVYAAHLKPRLLEIRAARGLDAVTPLPVDLLVVSHADEDHMRGILDLTRDLRAADGVPFVKVRRFWYNSLDEVIPVRDDVADAAQPGLEVLPTIALGQQLRLDAAALVMPVNPHVDGRLLVASEEALAIPNGLTLVVAGPTQPELRALRDTSDAWRHALKTSIVVLAQVEGATMLLTGDAQGDRILEGLAHAGLLERGEAFHVDLLKVPHHGCASDPASAFFERITADHYVFSGNGEGGQPQRASMERLFAVRKDAPFTVHLTYPLVEIDAARQHDWPGDWSADDHGLEAFFRNHPLSAGQKLEVVPAAGPHVIDLLDPLGF